MKDNKTKAVAIALALLLWQAAAMALDMHFLLASPVDVLKRMIGIVFEDGFFKTVFFSTGRIMLGFLLAFGFSILLAAASRLCKWIEAILWPYVVVMKSVPVASFIILCLIWLSYKQLTIFIAFLISFPVLYTNVLQGFKSVPKEMEEMAKVFHITGIKKFKYIDLPAVKPFILSASSVGVGMAFKAGVAAEVIGMIDGSIGEMLYESKIYFMTADLFAWTIIIVLLSICLEKVFVFLLKIFYQEVEKG